MGALSYLPLTIIALVSLQATFLQPYIVIISGERTNLFTTALTLAAFLVVLACPQARPARPGRGWRVWEPWAWASLGLLILVSTVLSPARNVAFYRACSFFFPALAGYWCGRLMADDERLNRWVELFLAGLYLILSLIQISRGFGPSVLSLNHNGMANLMLLLAAGPLSLLLRSASWKERAVWGCVVAVGFLACFLIGSRFVILLPFVLLPLLLLTGALRKRVAAVLLGAFLAVAALFFTLLPDKVLQMKNYESVFYRVEGIPAALHIVKQHPFFGIGIRAPREPYLQDYQLHFDLVDRDLFMEVVRKIGTSDNVLTTMLVGLGLVPTLVYLFMMGGYGLRLIRALKVRRESGLLHSAIGICLVASLIHFTLHDGLLYPQVNWFFHFFIGLLPLAAHVRE